MQARAPGKRQKQILSRSCHKMQSCGSFRNIWGATSLQTCHVTLLVRSVQLFVAINRHCVAVVNIAVLVYGDEWLANTCTWLLQCLVDMVLRSALGDIVASLANDTSNYLALKLSAMKFCNYTSNYFAEFGETRFICTEFFEAIQYACSRIHFSLGGSSLITSHIGQIDERKRATPSVCNRKERFSLTERNSEWR